MSTVDERDEDLLDDEPVHGYFGLTYANYKVLHRSLMQSMPVEWQRRMVACLTEADAAFAHLDTPVYDVTAATEIEYSELTKTQRRALGVRRSKETGRYYDRDGEEREGWHRALVPLPGGDPIPHYNRGRTRIPPAVVPTPPESAPASSAQGDEAGAGSPIPAPAAGAVT